MERRGDAIRLIAVRQELAGIQGQSAPFREVQAHVASFQEERPLMREYNTPIRMAEWMQGETGELLAEMQWGERPPTEEEMSRVKAELADVVIFSLNIGHLLGINVEAAILDKVAKNKERFPKELFQDLTQDFQEVYLRRKVELGERPHTVLLPGIPAKIKS